VPLRTPADPHREERLDIRPQFARSEEVGDIPREALREDSMSPETAYQVVHDELMLDGNARLNLATFVTTWMEPQAERLMRECFDKNIIDKDEYPQTAELESRCVTMLGRLWNASRQQAMTGCSTTGSSEACMLGGLALKRRWQNAGGQGRPNLVMGSNVQVCWDKFCEYWDIEPRQAEVGPDSTCLTPEKAVALCDENTIGVVAILGSTFDGVYEPVAEIAAALDKLQEEHGLDIPMHVDAASGGFIAPFLDPEVEWDFRLPRVQSINASGHKYGLVYPGVGWVVWRDKSALPEELVFHVDYLGGNMPTFALNFSRPGAQVAAQYFTFLRLGFEGYRRVQQACRDTAQWLAGEVAAMEPFELVSDGSALPVFAFRMAEDVTRYSVYDVSEMLRVRGWIVPAYKMPKGIEESVLRVVVRNGFSWDMARMLLADLATTTERLERTGGDPETSGRAGFHH
jgi:glutamate decarboxylase